MSTLARLQRQFQEYVLGDAGGAAFERSVVATRAASGDERLSIYRDAYSLRLIEVLGNDFLGLRDLAGDDRFHALCRAYVEETPSRHFNARWYGESLPDFLRLTSPWSAEGALAEMAHLDWMIGLSFDSPDEPYVTEAEMSALAAEEWPEMAIRLSGTVRRAVFAWNVPDIRRAVDAQIDRPPLQACDPPQSWIVSRQDYVVRYRRLNDDEAAALEAASQGRSFAELCDLLCEWHAIDSVAMRAAILLKAWIQNRWVTSLERAA